MYSNCKLEFMQDILSKKRKWFGSDEIKDVTIHKCYEEYAIKNVWPLVKNYKALHEYFPVKDIEKGTFTDRKYFWGILFT